MYRIVRNAQTGAYRVEKHGWLGWSFVMDPASPDYLQFVDLQSARDWVEQTARTHRDPSRRWQIVAECSR